MYLTPCTFKNVRRLFKGMCEYHVLMQFLIALANIVVV